MNRKSVMFILPLIMLVLLACQISSVDLNRTVVKSSGSMVKEDRVVTGVDRVFLNGIGDLNIIQGSEEGLNIEADQAIMPYIETRMSGSELIIGLKNRISFQDPGPIHFTLKVKNLSRVSVSGAGNVTSDKLSVGDLGLEISGAGNMKVADLQAQKLTARASGSGNFDLKGKVTSSDITITGAGNFNGGDLQSSSADVTISGAGDVNVWTTDRLDVHITGFGSVRYYGKPTITQNITGGGSVNSNGEHK